MRKSFMLPIAALCFGIANADTYGPDANGQTWYYTVSGSTVTLTGVEDKTTATDAATIPWVIDGHAVTAVGANAFRRINPANANLVGVLTIPDSVTTIGVAAFCDCTGLTEVKSWGGVTSWGDWAFGAYTAAAPMYMKGEFPDLSKATQLGSNMFTRCPNLTGSVEINPSLTAIPQGAFYQSYMGGTVVFPASVDTINYAKRIVSGAFRDCPNLEAVWVKGKAEAENQTYTSVYLMDFTRLCDSLEMVLMGRNTTAQLPDPINSILAGTSNVDWFAPANASWAPLTTSTIGGTGNKVWKYGPDEDFDLEIDDVAMTAVFMPKTADALVNALAWAPKFKRLFNLDTVISVTGSITVPEGAITAEMLQCVKLDSPSWFMTFAVKTQAQLDAVLAAVDGPVVVDITGSKEEITVPEGRSVAVLVPGGAAFNYRRRGLIVTFK